MKGQSCFFPWVSGRRLHGSQLEHGGDGICCFFLEPCPSSSPVSLAATSLIYLPTVFNFYVSILIFTLSIT